MTDLRQADVRGKSIFLDLASFFSEMNLQAIRLYRTWDGWQGLDEANVVN